MAESPSQKEIAVTKEQSVEVHATSVTPISLRTEPATETKREFLEQAHKCDVCGATFSSNERRTVVLYSAYLVSEGRGSNTLGQGITVQTYTDVERKTLGVCPQHTSFWIIAKVWNGLQFGVFLGFLGYVLGDALGGGFLGPIVGFGVGFLGGCFGRYEKLDDKIAEEMDKKETNRKVRWLTEKQYRDLKPHLFH